MTDDSTDSSNTMTTSINSIVNKCRLRKINKN